MVRALACQTEDIGVISHRDVHFHLLAFFVMINLIRHIFIQFLSYLRNNIYRIIRDLSRPAGRTILSKCH